MSGVNNRIHITNETQYFGSIAHFYPFGESLKRRCEVDQAFKPGYQPGLSRSYRRPISVATFLTGHPRLIACGPPCEEIVESHSPV